MIKAAISRFFISKSKICSNVKYFITSKSNVLSITGIPGSGKTSLALKLSKKYNAQVVSLDVFLQCYMFSNPEELKETYPAIYDYLSSDPFLYNKLMKRDYEGLDVKFEIGKFIGTIYLKCLTDKDHRYIIEGVQLIPIIDHDFFNNLPIIILRPSFIKTLFRVFLRRCKYREELIYEPIKDHLDNIKIAWNFTNNIEEWVERKNEMCQKDWYYDYRIRLENLIQNAYINFLNY